VNDRKLDALLQKVHAELQKVEKVDAENLKLLRDLEQDVQALLKKSGVETPNILERMRKGVERFELEHPTLTALLSEVSTILSNAGI
jgi:predicted  nucleic acid-binding Zn-ribbon protein